MDIVTLYDKEHDESVLRSKALAVKDLTPDLNDYTQKMIEFMIKGNGIGLAGPQIGDSRRIFVLQIPDGKPYVFINPEIIQTSEELSKYEEGCLSVPGVYSNVLRPAYVKVQAWNERGRPFTLEAEGLLATVIQHENDHLNGVLFVDHLNESRQSRILKIYKKKQKI